VAVSFIGGGKKPLTCCKKLKSLPHNGVHLAMNGIRTHFTRLNPWNIFLIWYEVFWGIFQELLFFIPLYSFMCSHCQISYLKSNMLNFWLI